MTLEYMQKRDADLKDIGKRIEALVNTYGRTKPIVITYERLTEEKLTDYSEWDLRRFSLSVQKECYFIWKDGELLYVVPVDMDSLLTAADELMQMVARKF